MTYLLIILATWLSEDLACIGAGLLVANGMITFVPAALASFAGIFTGDLMLYLAGRYVGRPMIGRAPLKWLFSAEDIERSSSRFAKKGLMVVPLCRFVPGTRMPTFFAAGLLRFPLARYASVLATAGVVWTCLLVGGAAMLGERAMEYFANYRHYALAGMLIAGAGLWLAVRFLVPLFNWRGRRLLLSRWRRLTRWEFWPLWVFYPPVVLYILWLALKHRSLSLFTAANPAIPAGGFLGESKSQILNGLFGANGFVARWSLVHSPHDVREFMKREGLQFPIVLKPDVGQRGLGVAVAKSEQDIQSYFAASRNGTIAQEYVPGLEFGVFYYRYPNETRGHIFSITEKRFPNVTGDGESTLEELILCDERAVCMARFFSWKHASRLGEVPADGQIVPLCELGTHCRGSVFKDGMWVKTPELEVVVDEISRGFAGFYVGRYDIRAPSVEDFRHGHNFKIVELNGVTSEATHIYQPGASLMTGYRTLMRQWRITFEVAAQNRARGVAPVPARDLLQMVSSYTPASEL